MIKVLFYQSKGDKFSINILFDIIKRHLPHSLNFSTVYFTYNGASFLSRIYDVLSVTFKSRHGINHVTGDFNYATFLMPKAATILTIHDLYRLHVYERSPVKAFMFKWFWLRIPVLKSGIITAVSQCTRDEILKYANCNPRKIRVIYNCISPDFKPVPKIFNKDKPVLLQVGTRANKNINRLAQAIAGISCKLEIVGKPDYETIRLLDHFQIDYHWESDLSRQAVIQKYADCDMLVFISTYEGFGMPIVEANAVERAVVTGNISAMTEIAGNAACLVDPFNIASIRNGIIRVISDDTYRQSLIDAGKENKQRFKAESIADQYYHLYKEVFAGKIKS